MKSIIILISSILFSFQIHAKEISKPQSLEENFCGAKIETMKKKYSRLRVISCRDKISIACKEKLKDKCSCFEMKENHPVIDVAYKTTMVAVHKNTIVEVGEEYEMQTPIISESMKENKTDGWSKVHEFSGSTPPIMLNYTGIDSGINGLMGKWSAKGDLNFVANIWCLNNFQDGKVQIKGNLKDCVLQQSVISKIRAFEKLPGNSFEAPY